MDKDKAIDYGATFTGGTLGLDQIYAAIDDYAYSAAFAIACACDEVWITRSAAGSVMR